MKKGAESYMDKNIQWYNEEKIKRTKAALEKRNYQVYVVESPEGAVEKLKEIMDKGSTVSVGGSVTLSESGVMELLKNGDYNFLDRYKEGLTGEDIEKLYRECFFADYYITSSNAITQDGELVNLDGTGNRVAAMIFGPKKVVVVAGINKIVKNLDDAYERVRNQAAPINCKRLNRKTPCTEVGRCMDCASPDRICNHYVVTYRQKAPGRGIVILIKQQMGY